MGKTDVIAAVAAGLTGAIAIFLYLSISLPLFLHIAPINLYMWDASNVLGIPAATHDPIPLIILIGQGAHVIVSLVWGFIYVMLARRYPVLLRQPLICGAVFGLFVMLFMRFLVVPLGHAPLTPYTLVGFTNTFIAHTLFFGIPVALVTSRLAPSPGSLKPGY